MKYIYGTLATLTAMMLTMTACTAESNETDTAQTRQMLFDATVGTGGATTRTVNTSLQTTYISVGNTVGAFIYRKGTKEDTAPQEIDIENFGYKKDYGYTNKLFTRVEDTHQLYSPTQPIFPQSGETSVDIYAYAPYNADYGTDWATTQKTFTVKTDQSSEADYIASDLLWTKMNTSTAAKEAETSHYTIFSTPFSHKLTQVQINVEYGDGVPAGTLNNIPVKLVNVLTSGTIDLTDGTVTASSTRGPVTVFTYKDAVADPATPAVASGTAIIYPHTADELTDGGAIQIEVNGNGFTYTVALKTPNITKLEAGKKYVYNVKVSSTGITFSAAISQWDNSEPVRPAEAKLPD